MVITDTKIFNFVSFSTSDLKKSTCIAFIFDGSSGYEKVQKKRCLPYPEDASKINAIHVVFLNQMSEMKQNEENVSSRKQKSFTFKLIPIYL